MSLKNLNVASKIPKTLEKKLNHKNNPPKFKVEFFKDQKNIKNINCFSNEGDKWEKSIIEISENILTIKFREAFKPRRGRINCSLQGDPNRNPGKWRWLGIQYVIAEY